MDNYQLEETPKFEWKRFGDCGWQLLNTNFSITATLLTCWYLRERGVVVKQFELLSEAKAYVEKLVLQCR